MKAVEANLLALIKSPKQFVIPIYQRTYSWKLSHCRKLLKDILSISNDPALNGHFIGSIVYFQPSIHTISDVPRLLVIDGQQRITTILLLVAALAEFVKKNDIEIDTNFNKLQRYYLINAEEESELRYKLLLTQKDRDTLNCIITGMPLPKEPSPRVVENYNFFQTEINTNNVINIYNGIMRLFVVDVALEKDRDNPQLIFESMNSTGLDLSQADLIRNYILMGQEIKIQNDIYEKYWHPMEELVSRDYSVHFDAFMRDYLTIKTGRIPNINRVYEYFKDFVEKNLIKSSIRDIVQDIAKYWRYYVNIRLYAETDKDLLLKFKNLSSKLKMDVAYPFLLPVYNDYKSSAISKDVFIDIISLVESYVLRRAICGIPTNSMNKTFANLYKSIKSDKYLESIQAAFQLMETYKQFPNDIEFTKEFIAKDIYNFRLRNFILNSLENYDRKEYANTDEYTIEHILPQNSNLSSEWKEMLGEKWKEIQQKYLHTIGNLTLTGYNSELSDSPFGVKKKMKGGFDESPLRINAFLRLTNQWNEEKIVERAKQLAEKANKIWQAPNLGDDVLKNYKQKAIKESSEYTLASYSLNPEMTALFNTLQRRILNIDPSVRTEFKKLYIAFKATTNFVDIVPQKSRLKLVLNMDFEDINDPLGLCKDITGLGKWGNGNVETELDSENKIDDIMDLIQQSFDLQIENQK